MATPTDVFIALDQGNYFNRFLYSFGGNVYQLIPGPIPVTLTPTPIQMWKSTDGGLTWAVLASSTLTVAIFQSTGLSPCLIGTQLFFWFIPGPGFGSVTGLAYFDFTTDTFTTVTTTANPGSPTGSRLLSGLDANHLFAVEVGALLKSIIIGEYIANAFSILSTLAVAAPYVHVEPQQIICGTSGILHVFYEGTQNPSSSVGPSDLGYVNVDGGVVNGAIGSNIIYPNYSNSFLIPDQGTGLGPPIQIGSTIYLSFYDPFSQQLKLISFHDTGSPAFTISIIDPSLTIAVDGNNDSPGSGSWSNVLAYYGTTLYCFYVNTWEGFVSSGDGNLYYRSSTDGGATWSARKTFITHLDPIDGTAFKIWYPQAMQFVGTPPASPKTAVLSYNQADADSQGKFGFNGRFATVFPLAVARNYVIS